MKSFKHVIVLIVFAIGLTGCSSAWRVPRDARVSGSPDLSKYKYVYINPTSDKTSISGGVYGTQYGILGGSSSTSINPASIVAGRFIKKGYIVIPALDEEHKKQTIVVQIAETGRKKYPILAYSIEMTLQLLDAATYNLICNVSAEGMGETETDDIRLAISKCMDAILR